MIDAHEDEGRIEGHGREGAGRQAGRPVGVVERGDHGDARGEVTENMSKFIRADHGFFM